MVVINRTVVIGIYFVCPKNLVVGTEWIEESLNWKINVADCGVFFCAYSNIKKEGPFLERNSHLF